MKKTHKNTPLLHKMYLYLFCQVFCIQRFYIPQNVYNEAKDICGHLNKIVESKCFSKIRINIDEPCKMSRLAKKCTYKECVVPRMLEDEVQNYPCRVGEKQDNVCVFYDLKDPKAINIDLLKARQTNSGYTEGAAEIWKKLHDAVKPNKYLAKLLSGIHFSVTIHVATFYYENRRIKLNSIHYITKRNSKHIENLLYVHNYVGLAVAKITNEQITCSIENNASDKDTFSDFLAYMKKYKGTSVDEIEYSEVKKYIAEVMECTNCIDCDKCKLWGKIQIIGLCAAIKLHSKHYFWGIIPGQDLIFLVNLYHKLTESIVYAYEIDQIKHVYLYLILNYHVEILTFAVAIAIFFGLYKRKSEPKKHKK